MVRPSFLYITELQSVTTILDCPCVMRHTTLSSFSPGPFVMNMEEEINQAVRDYRTGTNGFERAKAWRSKIRDSF